MSMSKPVITLICCLAVLASCLTVAGQEAKAKPTSSVASTEQNCPTIKLECAKDEISSDSPLKFSVEVKGIKQSEHLKYHWSVSAGVITSGDGTTAITVDSTTLNGQTLTVTVEIEGLNSQCQQTASCSITRAICDFPSFRIFDKYSHLPLAEEEARLDNVALQLKEELDSVVLIFVGYPSSQDTQPKKQAEIAAERTKNYLIAKRAIEESRISIIVSPTKYGHPFEEFTVELFIGIESDKFRPTP